MVRIKISYQLWGGWERWLGYWGKGGLNNFIQVLFDQAELGGNSRVFVGSTA